MLNLPFVGLQKYLFKIYHFFAELYKVYSMLLQNAQYFSSEEVPQQNSSERSQ